MIIAIDGPAGAGKSTVSRLVAVRLGLSFLDTGAMYRAVTMVALERGVDLSDNAACGQVARDIELSFDADDVIQIDGKCGEPAVRAPQIDAHVSEVSAHGDVREQIVAQQRALAQRLGGVVAEGRDTTTKVFPRADFKFFLVASKEERARRRALQMGDPERLGEVLEAIARRDAFDMSRKHSPLVEAPDAIRIDADHATVDEVVERIVEVVSGGMDVELDVPRGELKEQGTQGVGRKGASESGADNRARDGVEGTERA